MDTTETQKRIIGDLAAINRQYRSGAIDAEEASQDYMFVTKVKYEAQGRPE